MMYRSPHSFFFLRSGAVLVFLWSSLLYAFDLNQGREQGVKAYNQQKYKKAQSLFLKVVQHNSTYAPDYLKLARASYYAEDFELAHVAYLMFFELAPNQRKGSILDEFQGIKHQTDRERVLRRKKAYRDRVEKVLKSINRGEIQGKEGAFQELNQVYQDRIFEPRIRLTVKKLKEALQKQVEHIIHTWFALEEQNQIASLVKFRQFLKEVQNVSWIESEDFSLSQKTIHVLSILYTHPQKALDLLLKIKDSNRNLRMMQVIALGKLKRIDEALDLVSALNEQTQTAPLPQFLLLESQWRSQSDQKQEAGSLFAKTGRMIARQRTKAQTLNPQKSTRSTSKKKMKPSSKSIQPKIQK